MNCLFFVLEGFTAADLSAARTAASLPTLERLASEGVLADLTSPLADARAALLVSTMTGTWPDQHGILMAQTGDPATETLRAVEAADRARPALWEMLDAQGFESISVGWPVAITRETETAAIVGSGFGFTPTTDFQPDLSQLVFPPELGATLADCWLRPEELEISMIAALAPDWRSVNQSVDQRLALLGMVLAESVSRHAAFLELLDGRPWRFATLCLNLPAELASLERASEPLADGVFSGLSARARPLLDAFLAEVVRRLPSGTNLVLAGLPNPENPALNGFVLLHGPAFESKEALRTVSVMDLASLVLGACGTRSDVAWKPHADFRADDYAPLLVVHASKPKESGDQITAAEIWHYNALSVLARSLWGQGERLRALPVLEAIVKLAPNDRPSLLLLSSCQQSLGLLEEALDTAWVAVELLLPPDPASLLRAAELEVLTGHPATARQLLARAAPHTAGATELRIVRANVLIYLRDWSEASKVMARLVEETPQDAHAQTLLARCHLARRDWQAAFDCALASLNLSPFSPRTLEILGHALLGMEMLEQAWQAFESATVQNPRWPRPWAHLVWLARRMDKPKAEIDRCTDRFLEKRRENIDRRQALILAARSNQRSHFPNASAHALSEPGRPAAH